MADSAHPVPKIGLRRKLHWASSDQGKQCSYLQQATTRCDGVACPQQPGSICGTSTDPTVSSKMSSFENHIRI